MIPSVRLAKSGLVTSRLGFGTSRLHYLGPGERLGVLAAVADLGIVHVDTAPAYGDGLAEAVLGDFLRQGRERIIVATKYGIPADPLLQAFPQIGAPFRGARVIARRLGFGSFKRPQLSAAGLRASAEQSLRRLRIDCIDILFLHEPSIDRLGDPREMVEEFWHLRERGLIRAFGLAGAWSAIAPILSAAPGLGDVVQTSETEWPASSPPDITYGAIAGGEQSYFASGPASDVAAERLCAALSRRPNGVVLVSTTKLRNLSVLVKQAEASA
jgi:aryl-alcohol dehydrogenase-like predicted oxidoreductase